MVIQESTRVEMLHGIVSKRRDSTHRSGPTRDWLKIKTATWRAANRDCWGTVSGSLTEAMLRPCIDRRPVVERELAVDTDLQFAVSFLNPTLAEHQLISAPRRMSALGFGC